MKQETKPPLDEAQTKTKKRVLSDETVEKMRQEYERGASYRQLAKKYELSKSGVAGIITHRRRNQAFFAHAQKPIVGRWGKSDALVL